MFEWFCGLSNTVQALVATCFTWGVTALGASLVFFFKRVNKSVMDAMLGFAAGVMIAASFWSLLSPAIEMAEELNMVAPIVVLVGFMAGGVLLFFGDKCFDFFDKKYGKRSNVKNSSFKRALMLIVSITIHNIPEGICKLLHQKMYMKCKYFRTRQKKYKYYNYCTLNHCVIDKKVCKECNSITYKNYSKLNAKTSLKSKSKKLAKKERNRRSVFTNDFTKCIECSKTDKQMKIDKHECIGGFNRQNSIKYDLIVPLCRFCHEDKNILLKWKLKAQEYFVDKFGYNEYIQIFKIDFIEKNKKI